MILEAIRLAVPEIWNIYKHRKDKRSQVYNAIETIEKARNRTRFVIASNNYITHTPNAELSDLWVNAAAAVKDVDYNLYQRLLEKSDYWSDPEIGITKW